MFHDIFQKFFGDIGGRHRRPPDYDDGSNGFDQPWPPTWDSDHEDNMRDFNPVFDFKIISDPLEIHRLFEKQMNELSKVFTSVDGFPGIFGPDSFGHANVPAIGENNDPRDHYLKPGVKKSPPVGENFEDPNKRSGWLDLAKPSISPDQEESLPQPRVFSSFRSVVRKTVTLPDGTVKTEEVIRNSDGTEERRESHTKSDWSDVTFYDNPFAKPDISGFFDLRKMPELTYPKDPLLKPGYEKPNPNEAKIDKDLDKQILQSGVDILPSFVTEPESTQPKQNFSFKSVTRRTLTLPSGVVETEEIVRNPDGTQQKTITQTLPDDTNSTTKMEDPKVFNSSTFRGVKDLIDIFFK